MSGIDFLVTSISPSGVCGVGLYWMVLHEGLHGFIGGEAEVFKYIAVRLRVIPIALFGALPEEALPPVVVAKEGGVLHLALVLED